MNKTALAIIALGLEVAGVAGIPVLLYLFRAL